VKPVQHGANWLGLFIALRAAFGCSCALGQAPPSADDGAATGAASEGQLADTQAQARALFDAGRELLQQGRTDAACAALERSQALVPTIATLLNLGLCHRQGGRLATASEYYRRARSLAQELGDAQRAELAADEAEQLAARLGSVTLVVAAQPGAVIRLLVDGVEQGEDQRGSPIFLDAGPHSIAASAPGREPWQQVVLVRDGTPRLVTVPELRARSDPGGAQPGSAQRVAGVALGAVGVAGIVTGAIFGVLAATSNSRSDEHCSEFDICDATGLELQRDAHAHAKRATVVTACGVVALLGGVGLWLTAPRASELGVRAEVAFDRGLRVRLGGAF
jgi:hypothetical protein